jgi:hypothetical protein
MEHAISSLVCCRRLASKPQSGPKREIVLKMSMDDGPAAKIDGN